MHLSGKSVCFQMKRTYGRTLFPCVTLKRKFQLAVWGLALLFPKDFRQNSGSSACQSPHSEFSVLLLIDWAAAQRPVSGLCGVTLLFGEKKRKKKYVSVIYYTNMMVLLYSLGKKKKKKKKDVSVIYSTNMMSLALPWQTFWKYNYDFPGE